MIRLLVRMLTVALCLLALQFLVASFAHPASNLMLQRWLTGQKVTRQWVPLSAIARHVPRAVLSAEDGKFCVHHGVDWHAMHQAVEELVDEDDDHSHGASTVTMQVAKNLFLWHGRSFLRKGMEIPIALVIDAVWSKRRIMEIYLNIAEFGDGIFGVEAASQHYFRKSARALTAHEAALLAATLPNPRKRNPAAPSPFMASYAGRIEGRSHSVSLAGCGF